MLLYSDRCLSVDRQQQLVMLQTRKRFIRLSEGRWRKIGNCDQTENDERFRVL